MASLPACVGDQRSRENVTQTTAPVVVQPLPQQPDSALLAEVQTSANQTHNSLTGLGVQVAKLGEKVQGIGGDLLRLQASVETQVQASASLSANLRAALTADVTANLQTHASATAALVASLSNKLEGLAAGQVGLKNQLEQTEQTVKAGRDAYMQTVQFTREMQAALGQQNDMALAMERSRNRTEFWIVVSSGVLMLGLVALLLEASRRRAEGRYRAQARL